MSSTVFVCLGEECRKRVSEKILDLLQKAKPGEVQACRCLGDCERGVNIHINGQVVYEVTEENVFDKLKISSAKNTMHNQENPGLDILFDDF